MCVVKNVVPLTVILLLAGCSSWNPFSKSDPKQPTALTEIKASVIAHQNWSLNVGKADNYFFSPAIAGNMGFAASADGSVVKFDVGAGGIVWRTSAGSRLTAGVASDGSNVVVAGDKGKLIVLSAADGRVKWTAETSSEILSTPVVAPGIVIARTNDNRLLAYDAESGTRKWSLERPLPSLTVRAGSGLTIAGEYVIAAMPGGKLIAASWQTGAMKWEAAVGEPKGATELERVADVLGTPALIGKAVCSASFQGRVGCFDVMSGVQRWVKPMSSEVGVGADERFVFAVDATGVLNAYSKDTGTSVWKNNKLLYRGLTTPVSFGDAVVVGDLAGYLHFLSRDDGLFVARVPTDGSAVSGNPVIAGSNLIVQTKGGSVVAVGIN